MRIIIGLVIIIAGIGYAVYQTKKMNKLNLEIQSVETSKIADAIDIVNSLSATDSNYRHYMELKGNIFTKEKVTAPFTERETSQWMQRHSHYRSMWGHGTGEKFLGYRLVEKVLLANQPVYVLGELYKQGNSYYVGHSRIGQKASKLSYKCEDELVAGNQPAKRMSWIIAAVAAVIGIIVISQNF